MFDDLQEYTVKEARDLIIDEAWMYKVNPIITSFNDEIHISYDTNKETRERITFAASFELLTIIHVLNNKTAYDYNTCKCKSIDVVVLRFKELLKQYLKNIEKQYAF